MFYNFVCLQHQKNMLSFLLKLYNYHQNFPKDLLIYKPSGNANESRCIYFSLKVCDGTIHYPKKTLQILQVSLQHNIKYDIQPIAQAFVLLVRKARIISKAKKTLLLYHIFQNKDDMYPNKKNSHENSTIFPTTTKINRFVIVKS